MSKKDESTRRPLSLKAKAAPEAEAPRIEERLHKVLAQAGLGSRRALEQRIADGHSMPALGEGSACDWCAARGLCRKDSWATPAIPAAQEQS